ncbi:helix-turn-helix domain-containing protein [Actinopolymorpha pittospori]
MTGTWLPSRDDWIRQDHVDLEGFWESAAFRLHQAYDVTVKPAWRLDLDVQPWCELWLIREGECAIAIGEETAVARAGEVAILPPGRSRASANHQGTEPLSLIGFGCSLLLFETVDLVAQLPLPLLLKQPTDRLRDLIGEVVRSAAGGGADRVFRARAYAELALADVIEQSGTALPGTIPGLALRSEVRAALAFIGDHYAERLDLATLARAVHLSPKRLAYCFREALGVTPMAYLRRYRLERAREHLIASDLPITQIAYSTGFQEPAHFSRAFRTHFGISARTLRDHARAFRTTERR